MTRTVVSLNKLPLNILKTKENRDLEISKGRIRGVKREIVVFSCYFPPGMKKKEFEDMLEVLTDTISVIPKVQTPTSYNDLRPISMSTLWSKVLESIVSELTIKETGDYWKTNQFGRIKGSSTEHVLIESWDKILRQS